MKTETWTVTEAKAKFSALLNQVRIHGPQTITRNGCTAAIIVSAEEWALKAKRSGNLAEFFAESPLRGSDLKVIRRKDGPCGMAL